MCLYLCVGVGGIIRCLTGIISGFVGRLLCPSACAFSHNTFGCLREKDNLVLDMDSFTRPESKYFKLISILTFLLACGTLKMFMICLKEMSSLETCAMINANYVSFLQQCSLL